VNITTVVALLGLGAGAMLATTEGIGLPHGTSPVQPAAADNSAPESLASAVLFGVGTWTPVLGSLWNPENMCTQEPMPAEGEHCRARVKQLDQFLAERPASVRSAGLAIRARDVNQLADAIQALSALGEEPRNRSNGTDVVFIEATSEQAMVVPEGGCIPVVLICWPGSEVPPTWATAEIPW